MTVNTTKTIGITRAAHAGISVADLDRSIAFYSALTGREPVARGEMHSVAFGHTQGLPTANLRYATINLDNLGIDLIEFTDPRGERTDGHANRPGSMHLCFYVDDFDSMYSRLVDAGYDLAGVAYTFAEGEVTPEDAIGTKVAYFNDPDGTNLEIIAPKGGFAN